MFSTIFNSLTNLSVKQNKKKTSDTERNAIETGQESVENVLKLLNDLKEESSDESSGNISTTNSCNVSPAGLVDTTITYEANMEHASAENSKNKKVLARINAFQCLFTWKFESKSQNFITYIQKKYGDYNLDISLPEFTFVRFVGNLIISYQLYQNGKSNASYMKMIEIDNWLEKLDNGTDEFYLSINIALKHIKMANFMHMLFAENETGGFKLLFDDIFPFCNMDNKSKAAVHIIRAIILIEYGENLNSFINASKYVNKAIALDQKTSHWIHIRSLVLTAQQHYVFNQKLKTKNDKLENEINLAIRRAVLSSDGKCIRSITSFALTNLNQILENGFQMTLTLPLLKAVQSKYIFENNKKLNLEKEMKTIIEKHKNSEDAVPYLSDLIPKYNKHDRLKIMAQICSYTILFTKNLRASAEQFLILIEEFDISSIDLIRHNSEFINGSKDFNLIELIYNELRSAVDDMSSISHEDFLFYYKIFFKIEEICNLKMQIINLPMRNDDLSNRFKCSNITYQSKTDLLNIESESSATSTCSNKNNNNLLKKNEYKITECKTQQIKSSVIDLFDFKNLQSTIPFVNSLPNDENPMLSEYLSNFQMSTNVQQYTISKNILASSQPQFNLYNTNIQNHNLFDQYECSRSIPSLLNLQTTVYTNNIITTNITSSSMNIDLRLTKLPRISTTQMIYNQCLRKILKNYPNSFRIYTDASKIQDNVGIAIVSSTDTYSYKLSSEYTSNDAEAVAILRALDYALVKNYKNFIILSDSLSTITRIQNIDAESDIISSILCIMHAHQLKGNLMHFIWIPSHNAIKGNERADKLAKQIATSITAITYSHNSFMATNINYKFNEN